MAQALRVEFKTRYITLGCEAEERSEGTLRGRTRMWRGARPGSHSGRGRS
jgi:hypothetical protein